MRGLLVVSLFGLGFLALTPEAQAECCTAVEGVCSECCPGDSCGCAYGHETEKCVCSGCDGFETEENSGSDLSSSVLIERSVDGAWGTRLPVFLAAEGQVVLMDPDAASRRSFDTNLEPVAQSVSMTFRNLPVVEAVKLIATSAGFDVILPTWAEGNVDGQFPDLEWREAFEKVMFEAVGAKGRVEVLPNGLVRFAPEN